MMIVVNPQAGAGQSAVRWRKVKTALPVEAIAPDALELTCAPQAIASRLRHEAEVGDGRVVVCGGDGTIHEVLQQIMQLPDLLRRNVILGAVGAGSSNDFHKWSVNGKATCGGLPVRLSWRNVLRYNVGQADYADESGMQQRRFFMINASIGLIAAANWRFSHAQGVLKWLKRHWLNAAIALAGLRALFDERNQVADVIQGGVRTRDNITSLSILISPHISGSYKVNFDICPISDFLGIALCKSMGLWQRLRTFFSLAQGRFVGLPHTEHGYATDIIIYPTECVALEMDGEVVRARDIHIRLLKGAVNVCSR
jgi:diacylglycerol kinase (ATP)